jgi:hypothetical protein
LAGEEVIVFIWPLISLKIMFATNQISRIFTHGNPVDFTKGSPKVSKGELLAGEDAAMVEKASTTSMVEKESTGTIIVVSMVVYGRNSNAFRRIITIPDAGHGQVFISTVQCDAGM